MAKEVSEEQQKWEEVRRLYEDFDNKIYYFTVGELRKALQEFPDDLPVVVSGYRSGYENFFHPFVNKIRHFPENFYDEGQFQLDERGTEVVILQREERE